MPCVEDYLRSFKSIKSALLYYYSFGLFELIYIDIFAYI